MPAFESRRVRTQPLTVTGSSFGAWPAKIPRTLNSFLSIDRELLFVPEQKSDRGTASLSSARKRRWPTIRNDCTIRRAFTAVTPAPSEERHVRLPALRYQRPGADALGPQGRGFGRARRADGGKPRRPDLGRTASRSGRSPGQRNRQSGAGLHGEDGRDRRW